MYFRQNFKVAPPYHNISTQMSELSWGSSQFNFFLLFTISRLNAAIIKRFYLFLFVYIKIYLHKVEPPSMDEHTACSHSHGSFDECKHHRNKTDSLWQQRLP